MEKPSGHPARHQLLVETIRRGGPVTFAWWMEQALYHPEHGYYSSGRARIGRAGDYFTNVSVGPLFGRLMAGQFREMWEVLGRPEEFTIVEQGAHGGEFTRDVLGEMQDLEAVRYCIVEPFPALEARQRAALAAFAGRVSWCTSIAEAPPFTGVHFSNELFDALPVHVVRWTGDEWVERHVGERGGEFGWIDLPLSNRRLSDAVATIPRPLPGDYVTEINLAAPEMLAAIARRLTRGFVQVVDYGFPREEFYAPHRAAGTLRSYSGHRVLQSPFEMPGEADITAHVEWTSLIEQAQRCGMDVLGFADQHHFITGLLAGEAGRQFAGGTDSKSHRALQTLLHPVQLGMRFQFLVLSKAVSPAARLSGLRFALVDPAAHQPEPPAS